jgi:hypothetical protein
LGSLHLPLSLQNNGAVDVRPQTPDSKITYGINTRVISSVMGRQS